MAFFWGESGGFFVFSGAGGGPAAADRRAAARLRCCAFLRSRSLRSVSLFSAPSSARCRCLWYSVRNGPCASARTCLTTSSAAVIESERSVR